METKNTISKQKEKETLYQSLVELTNSSESHKYFSRKRIMEEVKEKIVRDLKEERNLAYLEMSGRAAYTPVCNEWHKNTKIDLRNILPRQKTLGPNLDELVEEGKAIFIEAIKEGYGNNGTKYYRAKI